MDIQDLGADRFLRKDPSQTDQTKSAVYTALNPAPKRGDDSFRKAGRPKGNEEDDGAPNVLTGTVITSCFIQTSALPSRIELQGNDLTFFDDTYEVNGQVIGDTSRLIFTHASGKSGEKITQGFIMEKRASELNTYDNVLSLYALPPKVGAHNFMFIGRDGRLETPEFNVQSITFGIDEDTTFEPGVDNPINGIFQVEYAEDTKFLGIPLSVGASKTILGPTFSGYSAFLTGGRGGIAGLAYVGVGVALYIKDPGSEVTLGLDFIPDTDAAYDIGSPSFQIKDIYVSGAIIGGSIALPGGITWTSGSGSPEAVVTAPIGSLYSNTAGGASTTLYVKTSGAGNTGWTAK